jgi:hypothetical protein
MTSRCVAKCVRKCVKQLHTSEPIRPRQHWAFASAPSPTTRPPRVRTLWIGAGSRTRGFGSEGDGGGGWEPGMRATQIQGKKDGGWGRDLR